MLMKVLVTDGNYKHSLAAVRALAQEGVEVHVSAESQRSLAGYSKYARLRLTYPDPRMGQKFIRAVEELDRKYEYDVILPIGSDTWNQFVVCDSDIRKKVPLPPREAYATASNKFATMLYAEKIGIPTPKTLLRYDDIASFARRAGLPIVIKPSFGSGGVRFIYLADQLVRDYGRELRDYWGAEVVQEYIPGDGYGFFALLNKGAVVARFMHRRLREFPITGGPSTAAESIYDPTLNEFGERILRGLNWHGIAMVEFKRDLRTGQFKLLEINPKFWGSLDLAIAAGVNFPYLACELVERGSVVPVTSYKLGVKYSWPFPDDLRRSITGVSAGIEFIRDLISPKTKKNIWMRDLGPTLYWLGRIAFLGARSSLEPLVRGLRWKPRGFSWVIPSQLAASSRPRSKNQVAWLQSLGISAILSLDEEGISPLLDAKQDVISYCHIPMKEHRPPDLEDLRRACAFITQQIGVGHKVLVHCRLGLGRTGTVLACYLIVKELMSPEVAIERVRSLRPGSIDRVQEEAVKKFHTNCLSREGPRESLLAGKVTDANRWCGP